MEKLRYRFSNRLTNDEIINLVDEYKKTVVPQVLEREANAKGNNPAILKRVVPTSAPNNQVPVPYARRIVSIISSYMFLPGLIAYSSDNQGYLEKLQEIFDYNKEPLESYKIGWQTSVHGVGYEMFSNEGVGEGTTLIDEQPGWEGTYPLFTKVPVAETIPIYDFEIVPNLQAFIRFYTIEAEETEYVYVYYADTKVDYLRKKNQHGLVLVGEQPHGYARPPLVVYDNNEDLIGDFAAVVPLIDAYDVLMSDSMNEFDRFAQAYLIAKGFTITEEAVDKIKHKRAFSLLNKDDSIEFLTKPIEVEFIKWMSEQVRAEIHRGTGIPNLDDYKWGGGASGETIDKFIYLMELFTGIKEAYFKEGLKKRIDVLSEYMGMAETSEEIDIKMNRNDPDKSALLADLLVKYSGHISEQTLIEQFADFVPDAKAEMKQLEAEKQKNLSRMGALLDVDKEDKEDEDEEDEEEEKKPNPFEKKAEAEAK